MAKETHIGCKSADPDLFRVITVCREFLRQKEKKFEIEELRVSSAFVYFIKVNTTGLEGYIGRKADDDKLVFMVLDSGRLNWALQEGFTRQQAYEKIGIFREAISIDSFIKWITGDAGYKLKAEFVKSAAA
jgi:hypothetical protein